MSVYSTMNCVSSVFQVALCRYYYLSLQVISWSVITWIHVFTILVNYLSLREVFLKCVPYRLMDVLLLSHFECIVIILLGSFDDYLFGVLIRVRCPYQLPYIPSETAFFLRFTRCSLSVICVIIILYDRLNSQWLTMSSKHYFLRIIQTACHSMNSHDLLFPPLMWPFFIPLLGVMCSNWSSRLQRYFMFLSLTLWKNRFLMLVQLCRFCVWLSPFMHTSTLLCLYFDPGILM